jgi:predicted membrane protein
MKLLLDIVWAILTVAGFVATYVPLWASAMNFNLWGIAWQIWVMIGFTVFWISLAIVLIRQHLKVKGLESEDAKLDREKKKLEIDKLNSERVKTDKDGFPTSL